MIRTAVVSSFCIFLAACGRNEAPVVEVPSTPETSVVTPSTEPQPTPEGATATSTPQPQAPPPRIAQAPAEDAPVAEFASVVEQYKGKQIPVDADPATNELIYLPIELVDSEVLKTEEGEPRYVGTISLRVPGGTKNPEAVYVFVANYEYMNGQWQFKSVTEALQSPTQEKVFENPVFKPELLK